MSDEALQRLLAQSGGEGEVESSAEFTLAPEKALEKLAAYQLPDPGLWPVKMVQGAVARGADDVSVVLEKARVYVRCRGGRPVRAADLLREMCSGASPKDRSDRHWVTGLRGAYGSQPVNLSFSDANERVTIEGTHIASQPLTEFQNSFEVKVEYVSSSWIGQNPIVASIHAAVARCCRYCPIPVYVDRRLVSQQSPQSGTAVSWAEGPEQREHTFELFPARPDGPPPFVKVGLSDASPENLHNRCAVLLTAKLCKEALRPVLLYWQQDGALLGPYLTDFATSAEIEIVLPGDLLRTDLSEVSVLRQDRAVPEARILSAAAAIAKLLHAHPEVNPPLPSAMARLAKGTGLAVQWSIAIATGLIFGYPVLDPTEASALRRQRANLLIAFQKLSELESLSLQKVEEGP